MPIYSRADIIAKLKALGGFKSLNVGCDISNQTQRPLCWDFSTGQMVEVDFFNRLGVAEKLDVSIAPVEDGVLNAGNDITAAWEDGLVPYGICTAAYMGTDPTAVTQPDMLTRESRFPAGWKGEAAKRKGVVRFTCQDFLTLASGVLNDHPGILGVDWQGGGHCIGMTIVGVNAKGGLWMSTPGTWGADFTSGWGSDPDRPGYYKLTENQCGAAFGNGYGAYVICGVTNNAV